MANRAASDTAKPAENKGHRATNQGTVDSSDSAPSDAIRIKKYANRRLYNTATSAYVTLESLAVMVKEGVPFVVVDAKTGEDLTRSVLTQIIVEQEANGTQNLLPIGFLRQLIQFYDDSLGSMVPNYLEHSMNAFAQSQEQMRETMGKAMGKAMGGMFPGNPLAEMVEETTKRNMAMWQNTMSMFTPFNGADTSEADTLRAQIAALEAKLAAMGEKG